MNPLSFRPLALPDKLLIERYVFPSQRQNCDLSFMNLMAWRFLYDTEICEYRGWLCFRFYAEKHLAYLTPIGGSDFSEILPLLQADAHARGHAFLLLGVGEAERGALLRCLPDGYAATPNRDYSDYIYLRSTLASLAGKKMQAKRNFAYRFERNYPDYTFSPLQAADIPDCLSLSEQWEREQQQAGRSDTADKEQCALRTVFSHWEALGGRGGVVRVKGRLVAFTYGAPINRDTFDICAEKADRTFEGAYAIVNRDFARSLPDQYVYINREEDLGLEGLRHAKLSYHPHLLLKKYHIMPKSLSPARPEPQPTTKE